MKRKNIKSFFSAVLNVWEYLMRTQLGNDTMKVGCQHYKRRTTNDLTNLIKTFENSEDWENILSWEASQFKLINNKVEAEQKPRGIDSRLKGERNWLCSGYILILHISRLNCIKWQLFVSRSREGIEAWEYCDHGWPGLCDKVWSSSEPVSQTLSQDD